MRYDGDFDGPARCGEHRRACVRVFRRARRACPAQTAERHSRTLDQLRPEAARARVRQRPTHGERVKTACSTSSPDNRLRDPTMPSLGIRAAGETDGGHADRRPLVSGCGQPLAVRRRPPAHPQSQSDDEGAGGAEVDARARRSAVPARRHVARRRSVTCPTR